MEILGNEAMGSAIHELSAADLDAVRGGTSALIRAVLNVILNKSGSGQVNGGPLTDPIEG